MDLGKLCQNRVSKFLVVFRDGGRQEGGSFEYDNISRKELNQGE